MTAWEAEAHLASNSSPGSSVSGMVPGVSDIASLDSPDRSLVVLKVRELLVADQAASERPAFSTRKVDPGHNPGSCRIGERKRRKTQQCDNGEFPDGASCPGRVQASNRSDGFGICNWFFMVTSSWS